METRSAEDIEYAALVDDVEQRLSHAESLGDRRATAAALGALADLHAEYARPDSALACYARALESDTEPTDPSLVSRWLRGAADVMTTVAVQEDVMPQYLVPLVSAVRPESWREDLLHDARRLLADALRHAHTASDDAALRAAWITIARIDAAEGKPLAARSRLEKLLDGAGDDDACADLHYWLWRLEEDTPTDRERRQRHAARALQLYQSLLQQTDTHLRRARVRELMAGS